MVNTMNKFRELSASLKADAAALRRDGVYGCCAGSYEHAAAHIDAILRESEAQSTSQKAVAWARPVYARPVNAPGTGEWDELVDIEFHTRPEKPEGEGWYPLVVALAASAERTEPCFDERRHREREQRDEALLRQALEALEFEAGGWEYPPPKTTAAIAALRERLGEGAEP